MKTNTRVFVSVLLLAVIWVAYTLLTQTATPLTGTELAIANVNGGNYEWAQMNLFDKSRNVLESAAIPYILSALALIGLWGRKAKQWIVEG